MYFHTGREITILFKGWTAKDTKELAFYLILIFALAILYQCLHGFQKLFVFKLRMPRRHPIRSQQELDAVLRRRLTKHIIVTLIYLVQISFGYILMLLVMTYNYLILAITALGITVGFYVSEPLIVRGIEIMYIARSEKLLDQQKSRAKNGHGEQLLQDHANHS